MHRMHPKQVAKMLDQNLLENFHKTSEYAQAKARYDLMQTVGLDIEAATVAQDISDM